MRVEWVIALLVLALGAGGVLLGGGGGVEEVRDGSPTARVRLVSERVEALRGLDFRRPVRARVLTPEQARATADAELRRTYPPRRREADEDVLELLGLLPPGSDLREIFRTVFGEQVAGFYDTRAERLALVREGGGGSAALDDIVLAHELNHALEDQRFELREPAPGTDDRSTAQAALIEGSATELMVRYARRHPGRGGLLGALEALGSQSEQTKLPRYVQESLEFPYLGGLEFVGALRRRARGTWRLVDEALRGRPPVSTEQVIHPGKWFAREAPLAVRLGTRRVLAPSGWRRAARGELGEWDTAAVLREGGSQSDARAAAAGWGGGRYELWRRGSRPANCSPPCRSHRVLVLRWRWDSARDATEFRAALLTWLALGLEARPTGRNSWRRGEGAIAVADGPRDTTLAMAPDERLAARLARG